MFGQNKHMGFEINKHSGEIYTTGSLRQQGNSHVVLKVLAKNSGVITGMDEDEALVHISVIETNDAPVFTSALYLGNVAEDSPFGTSVITVSAVDEDSILDWNRFFFRIQNGNTNFSFAIDPSSGVISVNSTLDREMWPVYNLTVTATDNGSPPSTGTTYVTVTIDDINDNTPILSSIEAQVKENQPKGTLIATLNASDSDLPPNQGPFTYWLVNLSTGSAFSLTTDGVLFTTRTIDREQISSYRVLVAVRDAGIPPLSSTTMIHIKVIDENDNPSLPRNIFIEVKYFGSSFHGGLIGNVHPEDQDESDTFYCAIKSGQLNMFTIPNGTCELMSSPFQGEATFNITIEATDQLHFPVNNSIYVNYKGFTNATLDSCILFYVSSSSMEEFMSNKYLRFVKALDSLFNLQASKTHVFGIKHLGSEILLLAVAKNYNGQYLSREVASGISVSHRKLLEAQSNVTLSRITSDPCLTSPCQNGATCNKNIYISRDVAVLESSAVIFVSPQKEIFNCTCPAGFTGELCEDDTDECQVNPCENKGTCVNTPGSFYCHCQSGFSGFFCSPDEDKCLKVKCQNGGACIPTQDGYHCHCVPGFEGEMCEQPINHCRSTPCVEGSCTNSQTGFSCQCPFGVSGVHCEEQSYGFEELSFMEFPPLDRRTNLISLEFATVQRKSLLLYNPGGTSSREFFALEILDGVIHLSYDLGSGPVRLHTNKQVADGYFHSVTARRIGNMGSLHVDNCTDEEKTGFCFSQSAGSSLKRTLDVGSNMMFGGIKTFESVLLHPGQIKTHDFVGCIRSIHVNGILLRPSMALATYNILDRCPRTTPSPCHSNPCQNSGVCHDLWSDYYCECKSIFTGSNCAKEMSEELVLRFNGNDYIEYVIKERFKRDYLLKGLLYDKQDENGRASRVVEIKFKTEDDGVLISVVGQTGFSMLKIKDRRPVYISKDTQSGHELDFTVDSPVADGVWHVLALLSNRQTTFLHLDNTSALNITEHSMDLSPVSVEKIILGAAVTGFTGCVQYFNVSGYTLPVSGHSEIVEVWPSSTLIQPSCSSPAVCLSSSCSEGDTAGVHCLSAHCQNRLGGCGLALRNTSCVCLHNVSDHACDICLLTTESRNQCPEAQGSAPLWLLALILPLISILMIIGICVYKVRHHKAEGQSDSSQHEPEHGTGNVVFCFDDNRTLTDAESNMQNVPIRACQLRLSAEFYRDASLTSVLPVPKTELEYYEIGSISSELHSDTASLTLSWHKHLYSTKGVKADPKQRGDLRMLLAEFKKECSSEERTTSQIKPQDVAFLNKQLLTKIDLQYAPFCHKKKLVELEYLDPVRCLTLQEISKLNTPQDKTMSHQASLKSGPTKTNTLINGSSDSEADSTLTGSESECGQFACNYRPQGILPVSALLKPTFPSDAGQHEAESAPSSMFEQWENILNMHLPFSSYAPVFEDIACLPTDQMYSYEMHSDKEEII
ncbi:protocadherin Fat 4 [Eleginops maclovinus]|uniref:protocadherin Fat 4 n=1 Tax=Eleginops maclovinus TaxID=56733 RepID=UPI00307FD001